MLIAEFVILIWQIPFSVILRQPGKDLEKFYETFHGSNINIQVIIYC